MSLNLLSNSLHPIHAKGGNAHLLYWAKLGTALMRISQPPHFPKSPTTSLLQPCYDTSSRPHLVVAFNSFTDRQWRCSQLGHRHSLFASSLPTESSKGNWIVLSSNSPGSTFAPLRSLTLFFLQNIPTIYHKRSFRHHLLQSSELDIRYNIRHLCWTLEGRSD